MYSISPDLDIGYSTLRLVTDEKAHASIPVGVVGWNKHRRWFGVRVLREDEKLKGVDKSRRHFISVASKQLQRWADQGHVPYEERETSPWESDFWKSVGRILSAAIRLEAPRAMDPEAATDEELDSLFEAVVKPEVAEGRTQTRIDGLVRRALGPMAGRTEYGLEVTAFRGARESVMRGVRGPSGTLILEGVNLAGQRARRDADALVSKILRIKEGENGTHIRAIVGYRASPGGLNGEAHLKEWIRHKATREVYDLTRHPELFQAAARRALGEIGMQQDLL